MNPFSLRHLALKRNNGECFITQRKKHVQPVKRTKRAGDPDGQDHRESEKYAGVWL